jgi:hypothetical protein
MDELLASITSAIKQIETSMGLDWRYSYWSARMEDAGLGRVEISSTEVFARLAKGGFGAAQCGPGEMELTGGGETRVRVRLLSAPAGRSLWILSSVADIRREPDHAAELVNQAIMGEDAEELVSLGEWYLVRLRDGYHGWVRSWYVREIDRREIDSYRRRANARVEANVAYIRSSPDEESLPISDIVAGSQLIAEEPAGGFRRVVLPDGRAGFVRESELGGLPDPAEPSREGIVSRAQRYLGIPYLWGGTSPKGFDCSGLVKRAFEMEGVDLPRDTDRQALTGREIPLEQAEPGDLLFFGEAGTISHVAIYLGGKRFIHAYGAVRINGLRAEDPSFDPKLAGRLKSVRVVLPS